MYKHALFAISILIITGAALAGTLISIDVGCGTTTSVYANVGTTVENVTIQATDKCAGGDSEVQLVDASGTITVHLKLKDKTTKTFRVAVPGSYSLNFVCNGDSGGCSYLLSVP